MEVITRRDLARTAAARWDRQYANYPCTPEQTAIGKALHALGPDPDPDAVDKTVGNGSWTELCCDECGTYPLPAVARVGEPPNYESSTADLCLRCAAKATHLLAEAA